MGIKSEGRNVATEKSDERRCAVPTMLDLEAKNSDTRSFRKALFELTQRRLLDGIQTITSLLSDLNDELELLETVYDVKDTSPCRNAEMGQTIAFLKSILRYAPRANVLFQQVLLPLFQKRAFRIEMEDLLRTPQLASLCRLSFLCQLLVLFIRQYTFDSEDKDNRRPRSSSHKEPATWSDRSETVHATIYELLEHEVIRLVSTCGTKAWGRSARIMRNRAGSMVSKDLLSAWQTTGHTDQIETISFLYDNGNHEYEPNDMTESLFREICYEVLISMDQWCPAHGVKIKMTMNASLRDWSRTMQNHQYLENDNSNNDVEKDMCSSTASDSSSLFSEERIALIPEAAREALGKVTGSVLPRDEIVSRVLWRILSAYRYNNGDDLGKKRSDDSVSTLNTTMSLEQSRSQIKMESRQSLFDMDMCRQSMGSVVAIASSVSSKGPSALEASIGKTTIAALIVHRQDVRRHVQDGVIWLNFEDNPGFLSYKRYRRLLEEILHQMQAAADVGSESEKSQSESNPHEWGVDRPVFPEMIPSMDESIRQSNISVQDHVEDGFKTHSFNLMGRFLRNKRVLLVLDNVNDNETLRWFNFSTFQASKKCSADHRRAFSLMVTTRNRRLLCAADTVEMDALRAEEVFQLLHAIPGAAGQPEPDTETIQALNMAGLNNPVLVSTMKRVIDRCRSGYTERIAFTRHILRTLGTSLERTSQPCLRPNQVFDQCIEVETETQTALRSCIRICFAAFGAVFACRDDEISEPSFSPRGPGVSVSMELCSIPVSVVDCLFDSVLRQSKDLQLKTVDPGLAPTIRLHLVKLGFLQKAKLDTIRLDVGRSGGWCCNIPHSIYKDYALSILGEISCDRNVIQLWNAGLAQSLVQSLFSSIDHGDEYKPDSPTQNAVEWGWTAPDDKLPMFQYALKRLPEHMIRGGLYKKSTQLLVTRSFIHDRVFQLGTEYASESLVREITWLLDQAPVRLLNRRAVVVKTWTLLGSHLADLLQGSLANGGECDKIRTEVECRAKAASEKSDNLQIGRGFLELGTSLCDMGYWNEAMPFLQSSLDAFSSSLGESSETTAALSYNLGCVHSKVHMYEDAIYYYTECLKMRRKLYGEKHSLVAMTLAAMSDALICIGEFSDAKKSYRLALDMLRHKPRLYRDKIGYIQERLGGLHFKLSEWETALQCYQSALLYRQAELGEDSPTIATVYHQMGMCQAHLGNAEPAIDNLDHAVILLEVPRGRHGDDDKDEWNQIQVLVTKGAKFDIQDKRRESLDRYSRAIGLLHNRIRRIKEIQAPAPVAEKILLASVLHSIGSIHQRSSNDKAAMRYFGESLAAYRNEETGTEMPCCLLETARTLVCMAQSLKNLGRTKEALSKLERALGILQKHSPGSALVAAAHENIAAVARAKGDMITAQASLKDALEIRRRLSNFDESHGSVAAVKKELSDLIDEIW